MFHAAAAVIIMHHRFIHRKQEAERKQRTARDDCDIFTQSSARKIKRKPAFDRQNSGSNSILSSIFFSFCMQAASDCV
jgi:hypothetical protein